MITDEIHAFWQSYLDTLPPDAPERTAAYIRIGRQPTADMPLVCERFGVIYP